MAAGAKARRFERQTLELTKEALPRLTAGGATTISRVVEICNEQASAHLCWLSPGVEVIILQNDNVEEINRLVRHLQMQRKQEQKRREREFALDVDDLIKDTLA